jgi:hypothetical protein
MPSTIATTKYGFCKVEWDSGAGRSVLACDALTVLS